MNDRELANSIDRVFGPNGHLASIEAGRKAIRSPEVVTTTAAMCVGHELGQPNDARAIDRLAADLAATKLEPGTRRCDCGGVQYHEPVQSADPEVGIMRPIEAHWYCPDCEKIDWDGDGHGDDDTRSDA